ncbi:MAG: hypothetical protein HC802_04960 [Caldilineaceae bacterium]|nr:hypothetical protein [Caldilineaceae bacterium]
MSAAESSVANAEPARRKSLEYRLGLEHSLFWSTTFRTLRAPGGSLGLVIVVTMIVISLAAPLLSPYDPLKIHKGEQFKPPPG